jgi:hypothetical protein
MNYLIPSSLGFLAVWMSRFVNVMKNPFILIKCYSIINVKLNNCFVDCLGSAHLHNIYQKSIIEVPIIMPCKLSKFVHA